jgi:hypothetical protein
MKNKKQTVSLMDIEEKLRQAIESILPRKIPCVIVMHDPVSHEAIYLTSVNEERTLDLLEDGTDFYLEKLEQAAASQQEEEAEEEEEKPIDTKTLN